MSWTGNKGLLESHCPWSSVIMIYPLRLFEHPLKDVNQIIQVLDLLGISHVFLVVSRNQALIHLQHDALSSKNYRPEA